MSTGSFLSAVGDAFSGYAQDKKNRAEQSLRDQQTKKLQREEADDTLLRSPEFGQAYASAFTTHDPTAIGNVVRMTAGHPRSPEIIKSLTREPKPDATTYDGERGVIINRETGTFTAPKGLPPKTYKPTDIDGLAAELKAQRLEKLKADRAARLNAAETAFNTTLDKNPAGLRAALVSTFNRLRNQNPKADPRELMAQAYDATNRRTVDAGHAARTDLTQSLAIEESQFANRTGGTGGPPVISSKQVISAIEAAQLKARGRTDAEIAANYTIQ